MIHLLENAAIDKARRFARQSPITTAVDAVLDGISPGKIWVDDPASPTTALVDTPEGCYLVGETPDERFTQSVNEFILDTLRPGEPGEDWWWFYLRCPSQDWAAAMRTVFPRERTVEKPREFYICEKVKLGAEIRAPVGFELVPVDQRILANENIVNIERLRRWARGSFGSFESFLAHGFAFCMLHDNQIISLCCADNTSQDRCEVGVHTFKGYRRKGLGALTVAAAVDWALSNGYRQVGWHCLKYNLASSATARKVGFEKVMDYSAFMVCTHSADAHLINGNLCLIRREFQQAADWYERGLRIAEEFGSASYLLAQQDAATRYTFQAACARALANLDNPDVGLVEAAIQEAGFRQGGY